MYHHHWACKYTTVWAGQSGLV